MEFKEYTLNELLPYEQPGAYIVESTDYNDAYKTPVLTAGKTFILGYTNETEGIFDRLPVIIFDDFTTASQYVNFKFKVKSSAMKILNINTDLVIPKYIYYQMQVINIDHSTHKRYWIQQYSKIKIKVPPIPEQQRIVSRIEELFSSLDNAVETLNKTKEQLTVYRQAVLEEEFKEEEKWEQCSLGSLMSMARNGYGSKPDDCGAYRILTIGSVRAFNLDLNNYRLNNTPFNDDDLIAENDLLFTRYNGNADFVGCCARVPQICEQYAYPDKLIKFRPKLNNIYHSKYLEYFVSHGNARKYLRSKIKTTSGQNGIAGSDIKKLVVFLPTLEKQTEIVLRIEERISRCNTVEVTVNKALQEAEAMRQSILKEAFEGRL